jgi:hypothetical protein
MNERHNEAKALQLKEEGNVFFKSKEFANAIQKYTEAIVTAALARLTVRISASFTPTDHVAIENYRSTKKYNFSYSELQRCRTSSQIGR